MLVLGLSGVREPVRRGSFLHRVVARGACPVPSRGNDRPTLHYPGSCVGRGRPARRGDEVSGTNSRVLLHGGRLGTPADWSGPARGICPGRPHQARPRNPTSRYIPAPRGGPRGKPVPAGKSRMRDNRCRPRFAGHTCHPEPAFHDDAGAQGLPVGRWEGLGGGRFPARLHQSC